MHMNSARILIITGKGKGKTTSAFGMALRAIGHQKNVALIQFIKHDGDYGEVIALRQLSHVSVHCSGLGFTPKKENSPQWSRHAEAAQQGWITACHYLQDEKTDMIILDEFFYALNYNFIPLKEVITALKRLPSHKILIMTGRNAPEELCQLADTLSIIECAKHALQTGTKAQESVEY